MGKENELGANEQENASALSGVKRASDKISDSEEDEAKQKEGVETEKHVDKKIKLSTEEVDSENSSKKANEVESDKKEMIMMKEEKDVTDEKVVQKGEIDKQLEEEEVEDEIEEIESDDEDEDEEEPVPEYICARELFVSPEVERDTTLLESQLKWSEPDEAGLIAFLVEKLGFNQARVESGIKKLKDAKGKSSQKRMDSFFKISGTSTSTKKKRRTEGKRKRC